jgi:hypothetical protein
MSPTDKFQFRRVHSTKPHRFVTSLRCPAAPTTTCRRDNPTTRRSWDD